MKSIEETERARIRFLCLKRIAESKDVERSLALAIRQFLEKHRSDFFTEKDFKMAQLEIFCLKNSIDLKKN